MEKSPKVCLFDIVELRLLCYKERHFSFDTLECIGKLRENACLHPTNWIWKAASLSINLFKLFRCNGAIDVNK